MESSATVIGILLGILASVAGAALAILSRSIQDLLNERREQNKLMSLVRGELLNIQRHCTVVKREVEKLNYSEGESTQRLKWLKRKHGELSFIKDNLVKLGFLNENMVKEFLQLALFIRNNDLEIDEIISCIDKSTGDDEWFSDAIRRMARRMSAAVSIAQTLLNEEELTIATGFGVSKLFGGK